MGPFTSCLRPCSQHTCSSSRPSGDILFENRSHSVLWTFMSPMTIQLTACRECSESSASNRFTESTSPGFGLRYQRHNSIGPESAWMTYQQRSSTLESAKWTTLCSNPSRAYRAMPPRSPRTEFRRSSCDTKWYPEMFARFLSNHVSVTPTICGDPTD